MVLEVDNRNKPNNFKVDPKNMKESLSLGNVR
jgi:hypothetical protein